MNPKLKAALASYARSFIAGALVAINLGKTDWQGILAAGLAAIVPVAMRALNKKDPAFGVIEDIALKEIDKLARASKSKKK